MYKSSSSVVDQLRYLRCYFHINSVIGYVIPYSKLPGLVTKIFVEWKIIGTTTQTNSVMFPSDFA